MLVTPAAGQPSRRAQAWLTFDVRQNQMIALQWIDSVFSDWGFTRLAHARRVVFTFRSPAVSYVIIAEVAFTTSSNTRFELRAGLAPSEREVVQDDPWRDVAEYYVFLRSSLIRRRTFSASTYPRWLSVIENPSLSHLNEALGRMEIFFTVGDDSLSTWQQRLIVGPIKKDGAELVATAQRL